MNEADMSLCLKRHGDSKGGGKKEKKNLKSGKKLPTFGIKE